MNWLFPGFLAGLAAAALPVWLHFLRSRPKRIIRFPSLQFLDSGAIRDTRRHRIQRWLVLLMRCCVIALIAAAFARPFWQKAFAGRGTLMVLAVDRSLSMQTAGRWETNRAWALRQLDELQPGDRAGLLLLNADPSWSVPVTDDLPRVRAALEALRPGFEKSLFAPALEMASSTLASDPATGKLLVWASDQQRLGWLGVDLGRPLPPGVRIRLAETAPLPSRQAAVVSASKLTGKPGGLDVVVRQFAPQSDSRRLTVKAGSRVVLEKEVTLNAGDNPLRIPFDWPDEAPGVSVSLDPDDLPADDTAWIASEGSSARSVLLDPPSRSDYVRHALESTASLEEAMKPFLLPEEGAWPAAPVAVLRTAFVFRSGRLGALERFRESGGALLVFADGSPEQNAWLGAQGIRVTDRPRRDSSSPDRLRNWDAEHPALDAFSRESLEPLMDVEFYGGRNLEGADLVPLASWPDGRTALAEWTRGGRRMLIAGFSPDRESTDWPVRGSFVPFLHRSVRWLGALTPAHASWHVGETVMLEGEGTVRALGGAADGTPFAAKRSWRPEIPGLYAFESGGTGRILAVNPPPEESDLTPWPDPQKLRQLGASSPVAGGRADFSTASEANRTLAENHQKIWWWLLAFCILLLFGELALANRTSI